MVKGVLLGGRGVSPDGQATLLDNTVISRKNPSFRTCIKVVGSGKNIEVYEFSKPIKIGASLSIAPSIKFLTDEEIMDILINPEKIYLHKSERSEEYKKRNVNKAKHRIRRLVQMNFDKVGKMLTLTFRDTHKFDVKSLSDCIVRFQYFIKKLKLTYPYVKYVAVPEFQDKNKRGAVHFHLIVDLPFVPVTELRKLWRYGFIKINKINSPDLVGVYVAKYLSKYAGDKRFDRHRAFYASQNLRHPVIKYGDYLKNRIAAIEKRGIIPAFTKTYRSDWCGEITYKSYNLYQSPAQKSDKDGND